MPPFKSDFLKMLSLFGIFMAPQAAAMTAVFGLVITDLALGILVSRKNKIPIVSFGARRTILKLAAYEFGILVMWISEQCLLSLPITHALCALIAMTELSSILKNLSTLTGVDLQGVISKFVGQKLNDQAK